MFKGSNVALITPFKNNKLDVDAYIKLIHLHLKNGTNGLVPAGTTGESPTLSHNEHQEIIQICIKESNGKIPVIAGTGSNSTEEAVSLTKHAEKAGANCALMVTPYYNKPTQEGLYQHFKLIAETVDIDQLLYNVPGRTAVDMSVDTTLRLAEIENIIGIKDATGDLRVIKQLVERCPEDFLLLTGDDATALDFILCGGHGGISVTANIVPKELQKVYLSAMSGQSDLAKELNKKLENLHDHLFLEANPIPVKWALHKMGKCHKGIRLPLLVLSEEYQSVISTDLEKLGLI